MITLAVDIGGTFTDGVCIKEDRLLYFSKTSSTPPNYIDGVITGINKIKHLVRFDNRDVNRFVHGTTVATNIMLERKEATLIKG
jgi:N-methylhydantoinase A